MRDQNVPMRLKRKAFNEYALPVMTYGCETWLLSNTQLEKLVTTQRKMEIIMVGVTLKDRKKYKLEVETKSGVTDYQEYKRKQTQMVGTRGEET